MVNFFSMINDTDKKVKVVMDKQLAEAKWASFHPMDCTGSTAIRGEGILKLKELAGRDDASFEILDFTQFGESQPSSGGIKGVFEEKKAQ